MQTTEAGPQGLAGCVCERIEALELRITGFQQGLFPALSQANEQGNFHAKASTSLRYLSVQLTACETIFQVHHDLLDSLGRCSDLQRLTGIQDRIGECVELIDVFMEATND